MSAFWLKLIALTAMIIDHTGAAFSFSYDTEWMRIIGRLVFPIYAFLISEGCRNTRDMKKYLARLGIFALISEIPFDFLFGNIAGYGEGKLIWFYPLHQNVFFTLFFGVLALYLFEKNRSKSDFIHNPLPYLLSWLALMAAELLNTDYGGFGVFIIIVLYHLKERSRQLLAILVFIIIMYLPMPRMIIGASLSFGLIYLYNGKRGPGIKWFFYVMYPLHLSILGIVRAIAYMK